MTPLLQKEGKLLIYIPLVSPPYLRRSTLTNGQWEVVDYLVSFYRANKSYILIIFSQTSLFTGIPFSRFSFLVRSTFSPGYLIFDEESTGIDL
jgi:hypothetical protein